MSKETKAENNIFLLRFFGENITPKSFTAKELGNILIKYEEAILSIVECKFPEIELSEVKLSCIEIQDKSEGLAFSTLDSPPKVNEACLLYGQAINNNSYTDLPKKSYESVKYIYEQAKQKQCDVEYKHVEETIFTIKSEAFEIIKPESVRIYSETIIYGELLKIGGDIAKAWIELHNGNRINFSVTKDEAKQLSPKLYGGTIALKGTATLNVNTNNIVGFKLGKVIEYKSGNLSAAFEKLRGLTSGVWDEYKNNDDINKALGRT